MESIQNTPPPPHTKRLYIYFLIPILFLISAVIFLAISNNSLRNQIRSLRQDINKAPPQPEEIQEMGSISGVKTVNTGNWKDSTGSLVQSRKFEYSYQYPEKLYAVPNVRGDKNTMYFFENQSSYNKFLECIQDKPATNSTLFRDWEFGCNSEGDLLFALWFDYSKTALQSQYQKADLTSYRGPSDEFHWIIPKEDRQLSGQVPEITAEGTSLNTLDTIGVVLTYSGAGSTIDTTKNLTGLDMYHLLIHILSTVKASP